MTPSLTFIVKDKKKFICNVCEIELYDNSILHKHIKRKHVNKTKVMVENKKENIINQLLVQNKKVSLSEDIKKVIEIQYTKASTIRVLILTHDFLFTFWLLETDY